MRLSSPKATLNKVDAPRITDVLHGPSPSRSHTGPSSDHGNWTNVASLSRPPGGPQFMPHVRNPTSTLPKDHKLRPRVFSQGSVFFSLPKSNHIGDQQGEPGQGPQVERIQVVARIERRRGEHPCRKNTARHGRSLSSSTESKGNPMMFHRTFPVESGCHA